MNGICPPAPGLAQQTEDSVTSYTSYTDRGPGAPSPVLWTPARVAERLRKAAALLEPQGGCVLECATTSESIGIIGVRDGRPADGAVAVDAAEALSWLRWIEPDDSGIVVRRLQGAPWKAICWRFGISRPTADRRWRYALALMAWRLNGHGSNRRPSLRALLGKRLAG